MAAPLSLVGQRFGRLVVRALNLPTKLARRWSCLCDCGTPAIVSTANLRSGHTASCGCLKSERCAASGRATRKHGFAKAKGNTYRVWTSMRERCSNPRHHAWHNYGGRGISVCAKWSDFSAFLADMGEKPAGRSLDRINNDGNYEPGNCRWATAAQQRNNQRKGRK